MKLCECGCGQPAPIATRTHRRYGHIKGQPMKRILGHGNKNPREQRFLAKIQKTDGCWLWCGGNGTDGYGSFDSKGAHRTAYEIYKGPIPPGMQIMHSCDVPLCVNPNHLSLGTTQDNTRDRDLKGRTAKGERSGHATITSEIARQIKSSYVPRVNSMQSVAEQFGVSKWIVYDIVRGKSWRHLHRSNA